MAGIFNWLTDGEVSQEDSEGMRYFSLEILLSFWPQYQMPKGRRCCQNITTTTRPRPVSSSANLCRRNSIFATCTHHGQTARRNHAAAAPSAQGDCDWFTVANWAVTLHDGSPPLGGLKHSVHAVLHKADPRYKAAGAGWCLVVEVVPYLLNGYGLHNAPLLRTKMRHAPSQQN